MGPPTGIAGALSPASWQNRRDRVSSVLSGPLRLGRLFGAGLDDSRHARTREGHPDPLFIVDTQHDPVGGRIDRRDRAVDPAGGQDLVVLLEGVDHRATLLFL